MLKILILHIFQAENYLGDIFKPHPWFGKQLSLLLSYFVDKIRKG